MIKPKILKWRDYPELTAWALNSIWCIHIRRRQGRFDTDREDDVKLHQRERERDLKMLALETEMMWSQAKEYQQLPGTARVKGEVLPQSLPRLCSPVVTLIFGPVKLITDFWPPDLWEHTFLLFEATKFMAICHSSHRKWTHYSDHHHTT